MNRIAHIRTWTYIAHRPDWLRRRRALAGARPRHRGQALGRAARPADPAFRRSPFRRCWRGGAATSADLLASVNAAGEVAVEGERDRPARRVPLQARGRSAQGRCWRRRAARCAARSRRGSAARRRRPMPNCAWRPTARSSGATRRSGGSPPATTCSSRASRFSPPSISRARRARPCAAASPISPRPTYAACWRRFRRGRGADGRARRAPFCSGSPRGWAWCRAPLSPTRPRRCRPTSARRWRKLGVHFGAAHLYFPALLKQKPQAIARAALVGGAWRQPAGAARRHRRAARPRRVGGILRGARLRRPGRAGAAGRPARDAGGDAAAARPARPVRGDAGTGEARRRAARGIGGDAAGASAIARSPTPTARSPSTRGPASSPSATVRRRGARIAPRPRATIPSPSSRS